MRIDVHQHLWSEPLVGALAERQELPFARREHGLTVLYLAGERPYVIDLVGEDPAGRAALVQRDGLGGALLSLSSALGIEWLPRSQARPLIDAYHEGALSLGRPFGVWGAIALDRPDPDDVDRALEQGCVGISLPAGALASTTAAAALAPLLARLEARGAPLFVHPGPGPDGCGPIREAVLHDPLWWPAMTAYVASMQAAWLAFLTAGRPAHPRLKVVFAMLAGLAPLHAERLCSRGGPSSCPGDPLVFYDTSSYGPRAVQALVGVLGGTGQLLYGSDRPVADPGQHGLARRLDWKAIVAATGRALGGSVPAFDRSPAPTLRVPVEA